jgi:hypothetical protein
MTKDELILIDKSKVRGSSNLMSIYIDLFSQEFGKKPNCAGCTFSNDWIRFVNSVKGNNKYDKPKFKTMENTFELKKKGSDILRYQKNGKTYRKYSNKITEHFAIEFLTYGTEEQISERKKMFKVLPVSFTEKPLTSEQVIESLKDITDIEVLNEMLSSEERKTVKAAIKKRIKQLTL